MNEMHERLSRYLRDQHVQLNVVASNPRQGGTMLLICTGCAEPSEGHIPIGLLNEPGNLGVLPGCPYDENENPRSEADMDRLVLLAAKLAVLRHRFDTEDGDDALHARHLDLCRRLQVPRIPGAGGHYDPRHDIELLSDVDTLEQQFDRWASGRSSAPLSSERPRLMLTIKEHNYNRNETEFIRLLNLVKQSGGSMLFTTRHPVDCFNSFLLRRTVHFLSAEGKVNNREIEDFVKRLFLPSVSSADAQQSMLDYLTHCMTAGFRDSGDRIDRNRFLAFVGKTPTDTPTFQDIRAAGQAIREHCLSIMGISYTNTARYFQLARTRLPDATHRVDFDALLADPNGFLASLAREIPWLRGFRTDHWNSNPLNRFINFPEAFVLPGSEIERNVWFKDTLSATGIRPRTANASRTPLLPAEHESCLDDLEKSYFALFTTVPVSVV